MRNSTELDRLLEQAVAAALGVRYVRAVPRRARQLAIGPARRRGAIGERLRIRQRRPA